MSVSWFSHVKSNFKVKHYTNYAAVLVALVVTAVLFYSGSMRASTANLLMQIGYSIILAVSLNIVVGFLGELSLGHAGFMCVGAYIGCFVANALHGVVGSKLLLLIIGMIVGGAAAALCGLLIGIPVLKLKGDYLAITTLAFGEIVRNVFMNLECFGGALGLRTSSIRYGNSEFIVAFAVLFVILVITQNLIRSKHGRAITAIRDNEIAAHSMGINVTFYKLFAFVLSAFFTGIAGVLYGFATTPISYAAFSYNYSIEILVMVVLGGMGSINGSIISATLLTFINFNLTTKLSGDLAALKYLIYAIILITLVIFNNAPALKSVREKYSPSILLRKLFPHKKQSLEKVKDDEAQWSRIPTKVKMDELLSADIRPEDPFTPDRPEKGD